MMAVPGFRTLPRARCLSLLGSAAVGRVGLSVGALPAILPVNFVLARDRVVFRTVPGSKLDSALARTVVAFEADGYDAAGTWGWSVLVQGMATELTAASDLEDARRLPLTAWAFPGGAPRFVAVETTFVSGRAFGALPERDGGSG
jgi:nitroimidazol reductase NimA-like FMN-containing flavoprotein (pyridoxamine 5'-phosphate oxidase superfamily)